FRYLGFEGHRQDARGRDHERGDEGLPHPRLDQPCCGVLVEAHRDDLCIERDVASQVEPVRTRVRTPSSRNRCSAYRPEKPAPMTIAPNRSAIVAPPRARTKGQLRA